MIDPTFINAQPPRPRASSQPIKSQPRPSLEPVGNNATISDINSKKVEPKMRQTSAFKLIVAARVPEKYPAYSSYVFILGGVIVLGGIVILWLPMAAYMMLGLAVIAGLMIRFSSRFLFFGLCGVLGELIIMLAMRQLFASQRIADFFYILFFTAIAYLFVETIITRFKPKDKITTVRGIKHNRLFQRVLVRKYQKSASSDSIKHR